MVKVGAQSTCSQATPTDPNDITGTCTTPGNPTPDTKSTKGVCVSPSTFIPDTYGVCTIPSGASQYSGANPCWTQTSCALSNGTFAAYYNLLAPLPNIGAIFDPTSAPGAQNNNLGIYLNMMITIFIGICAVLAVVMIVIGGMEYMTSELIASKEEGKDRILHAIFGLLLALGAWTILNQINPALLKTDLGSLQNVTVDVGLGAMASTPSTPIPGGDSALQALGITDCTGSGGKASVDTIAQEFIGKTNYSQTNRNTISGNTINLDCTSFVDQVYNCAGLAMPQITGANIASVTSSPNTKQVNGATFDFTTLNPGDIVGWGTNSNGHVAIYMGNGKVIDTNGSGNTQILPLSTYQSRITFVKWP